MERTPAALAKMIDHTLLKPNITNEEMKQACDLARAYGFKSVAMNAAMIPFAARELAGSGVLCDSAVGFPLGQCTIETKAFEAEDAIRKGAGEIDYVLNIVEANNGTWDYIEREMRAIVGVCNAHGLTSKVVFETCYLSDEQKRKVCEIAVRVRPTFVKTSTGFGPGGATLEDVRLMKACVGDAVLVKASGGIRTASQALAFIEAGASRIGTSNGARLVDEYAAMLRAEKEQ